MSRKPTFGITTYNYTPGDLLNLARHADVDFSQALRHANTKFERRFRAMEKIAREEGQPLAERDLEAQEVLWQRVKGDEALQL